MKTCNSCGQLIKDDSIFCPFCGSKADIAAASDSDMQETEAGLQESSENALQVSEEKNETLQVEETSPDSYEEQQTATSQAEQQDLAKGSTVQDNPYMQQYNMPQAAQQAQQPQAAQQAQQPQMAQPAQQPQQAQAAQQAQPPYPYAQQVQNPYMQQPIQQPMPQPSYYAQGQANMQAYRAMNEKPMSVGEWILTLIVMSIPIANIIMMFVWGFGDGNTSRKNYCRAYLIFVAITFVLAIIYIILIVALAGAASAEFHNSYYYY